MMEGFPDRVYKDLKTYKDEDGFELEYEPIITAEINRNIGKWIGMSMISSMSAFDKLFIKKQDYQELEYYKSIGSKLGIEKAKIQIDKDKTKIALTFNIYINNIN